MSHSNSITRTPLPSSLGPQRAVPRRPSSAGGAAGSLAALWRDIVGSWRSAIARSREAEIDEATLRDLGLSRSELASLQVDRHVMDTRQRILQQGPGGY